MLDTLDYKSGFVFHAMRVMLANDAVHMSSCNHLKSCLIRVKGFSANLVFGTVEQPTGIFGVPLRQSITYANVAISLVDESGKSYIYGYVPIVVAKCGVYLKEKGRDLVRLILTYAN